MKIPEGAFVRKFEDPAH